MIKILNLISLWALPFLILLVLTIGVIRKVPVYEEFTHGAKDIEMLASAIAPLLKSCHIPADVLPLTIVRSLSGSAALGVFSDIANNLGPDSYATKLAAIMVGSSETTFYVLAVYFGAVKISKIRYALIVGLLADLVGIIAAVWVCNLMFG